MKGRIGSMQGLQLSRLFFEEIGRPSLEQNFGNILDELAAGLCGEGSECFGYDDDVSRDHDFLPCFDIWVKNRDKNLCDELRRWYAHLPKEYAGGR